MRTFFLLLSLTISYHLFAQTEVVQQKDDNINNYELIISDEEITDDEELISDDDFQDLILESDSDLIIPEAWDTNFDNLLNSWYLKNSADKINHIGYQEVVHATDSVLIDRLSKLPNIIELPFNSTVRNCINLYIERRRGLVETMLGLEPVYFPMIEETLDKYGLPLELKYLVIIESALNPVALSKAGASGLWQFIISTGKSYDLEINSLVDERRDPIKSTDAACRFLRDLYNTYEDWNLAIAAYNCGGGNVNKAIRRANGKKDYWAIYPYLPKETRMYVPFFIAANYAMNYYAYHKLYPIPTPLPLLSDTVMVNKMIHFDQIAEILQIDKDIIRTLNPQYKRDIIPGNSKPRILKLPTIQAYSFVEKEDEIASHRVDELFKNRTVINEGRTTNSTEKITHKVVSGETTLLAIANKYGVTVANVRKWNGLGTRTTVVAVGRNLTLHVDNGGYPVGNSTVSSSAAKPAASTSTVARNTISTSGTVQYRVKSGESYASIAQRYKGYTYKDLMSLNNTNSTSLKVGQIILVPKN